VRRRVGTQRREAGWSGLTESELRVARLAAGGLTNRQIGERLFLSPHTVSSHLRHTFTKLDISSRVELVKIATRHEQTRSSARDQYRVRPLTSGDPHHLNAGVGPACLRTCANYVIDSLTFTPDTHARR